MTPRTIPHHGRAAGNKPQKVTVVDTVQQSFEDSLERSESDLLVFISSVMTGDLKSAREEVVRTFKNFPIAPTLGI